MSSRFDYLTSEQLRLQLENNIDCIRSLFNNESKNSQSIGWQLLDIIQTLSERIQRIEETGVVERFKKAECMK